MNRNTVTLLVGVGILSLVGFYMIRAVQKTAQSVKPASVDELMNQLSNPIGTNAQRN